MASASFLYNRPVAEHNRPGTERPPRPPRAETREIVELKQLKVEQPELAAAVDMQVALVDMQRRVPPRRPAPGGWGGENRLSRTPAAGRPAGRAPPTPPCRGGISST